MAKELVRAWQSLIGAPQSGEFDELTLNTSKQMLRRAGEKEPETEPAPVPLSARVLRVCLAEAGRWGANRVSKERVAEYFAGCERNGKNIGGWLAGEVLKGKHHSFCAAARGWAESQALVVPETAWPWRAGALELGRDAERGGRHGQRFVDVSDVVNGKEPPPHPGAIAVYQNTQDATRGHIETIIVADSTGYRSVGANEQGGRWVIDKTPIPYAAAEKSDGSQRLALLGFVVDT